MSKKMQQNIILFIIVASGLAYVYYNYLYVPLNQKYEDSVQRLEKTEKRLNEMKRRALELPKLLAEMKMLEQEVADLESLLPKEKEIPDLLRTVTRVAQKHQLRLSAISPDKISAQPNYNELPFQLTVQGTYHNVARFLAEIGQETRILTTRNLNFTAAQGTKENPVTANVTFTLSAYTFKE